MSKYPTRNDMFVGNRFKSKSGKSVCEIIEADDCRKIKIKWLDEHGFIAVVHATALRRGAVKNPYEPTICGVGYFGVGPHRANISSRDTREYKIWSHMLERCYSDKVSSYKEYGLKGVRVCEEWHNFQNFANWLSKQEFWGDEGYQLDKDILGDGMEYSPEKCCYVPQEINTAMRSYFNKKAANIVVDKRRERHRWQVTSSMLGKKTQVGMFDCQEDAEQASIAAKIKVVRTLADMFKNKMPEKVYQKLMSWKPPFLIKGQT